METETGEAVGMGCSRMLMVQHILSSRKVFIGMRDQHHPQTLKKNLLQ